MLPGLVLRALDWRRLMSRALDSRRLRRLLEDAGFTGLDWAGSELGRESVTSVPCWESGDEADEAFSACVFDEDGGVSAGVTLVLPAEAFVFEARRKSRSTSDLNLSR